MVRNFGFSSVKEKIIDHPSTVLFKEFCSFVEWDESSLKYNIIWGGAEKSVEWRIDDAVLNSI